MMAESAPSSCPPEPHMIRSSAILEGSPEQFPRTLSDIAIDDTERMKPKRLEKLRNAVFDVIPVGVDNSRLLSRVGERVQFHPDLAQPDSNSRHVYVVCNPHWPLTLLCDHWSLYTQGHFYHLTTILGHQDLSSKYTLDYKNYDEKRRKRCLIAFQVGKTNYTNDEIYKVASWVIKQMPIYHRFSDNCQMFVIALMERIVMTKRDFASFVGNGIQLVEWDIGRSTSISRSGNSHQSCFQNGFELSSGVTEVFWVRKSPARYL
ncbi:hypothetical protein GJ744_001113 [Endocarpon pusillum]|uniref:PPPDE domain-containing protein n=1 Tax=Endocarpon pusillum TaxID=364733 RepID=A0A8H7AHI8_9EURO|nr:hypothetical protein GJ744_001113 [Endocarpon pusillum]